MGDLLRHFPHRYLDVTRAPRLADVRPGEDVTVVGRVHEVRVKRPRPRLTITEVALVDGTGVVLGVWFNQPWVAKRFSKGDRVAFAGKVRLEFDLPQIRNPFVEPLAEDEEEAGRLIPMHPATEGLSPNWIRRLVREAVDAFAGVPDPLPARLRRRHDLFRRATAVEQIHFPDDAASLASARRRLVYEEFLASQLRAARRRARRGGPGSGVGHVVDGPTPRRMRGTLPFTLTEDQECAVAEILEDMAGTEPMNRMLLGDVGTGKTVVAAIALAAVHDTGTQAAMMAPTSVLATQYARAVGALLERAGVPWATLTGSTRDPEREEALAGLADGSLSVVLGTHALFSQDVVFDRLSLTVVDEQHRFGVMQRLALREKGASPDLLVMSATPIPRSLALTLHGDLDTSYLRQRPTGHTSADAVRTHVVTRGEREPAYAAVRRAVSEGRRAYVVCPLVEESPETEARAVSAEADRLSRDVFPDLRLEPLTGQTRPEEKARIMRDFAEGDIDVLVATTVIEVGIDVPEATVMIVEDADRFGLSQLHQLRGRVARGVVPGECYLFADPRTPEGHKRIAAMADISDGFELAEFDLRLRGQGELLGERQSGFSGFRLASLSEDADLLEAARVDAVDIVRADPELDDPRHRCLEMDPWMSDREAVDWTGSG